MTDLECIKQLRTVRRELARKEANFHGPLARRQVTEAIAGLDEALEALVRLAGNRLVEGALQDV